MTSDPSEPNSKRALKSKTESGQNFASGRRPEKLISCPFVHPLLLTAVTSSKKISCGGMAVKHKEKRERKIKIKTH